MNPLIQLGELGQSVWLDFIRRNFVTAGDLRRLIDGDGLKGVTSNPTIFQKAISGGTDYDDDIAASVREGLDTPAIYESLVVEDIRLAADVLWPVYEATGGRDGFVSLEVSPDLAHDAARTVEEARRLWGRVDKSNLMIKVPATAEGLPAVTQLLGEGINVNVTLLFAVEVYENVVEAFFRGMEAAAEAGRDLGRINSVASFFVSRIDTRVDAEVRQRLAAQPAAEERRKLDNVKGRVAIANAKMANESCRRLFSSDRWRALAARGATTQRLLWASTSTKDPDYRDVLYVEELAGPDTVNTLPPETIDAFRDHGRVRRAIDEDLDGARRVLADLADLGISLGEVTDALTKEGVAKFADSFHELLDAIEKEKEKV